jgi:hypothetical protein
MVIRGSTAPQSTRINSSPRRIVARRHIRGLTLPPCTPTGVEQVPHGRCERCHSGLRCGGSFHCDMAIGGIYLGTLRCCGAADHRMGTS